MRIAALLILICCKYITGFSQSFYPDSTCATSTALCVLDSFSVDSLPHGGSSFTPGCFGLNVANNGYWYRFTVNASGELAWQCTPTGQHVELDWALYNISNGCPSNAEANDFVSCNFNYSGAHSYPIGMSAASGTVCPISTDPGTPAGEFCPSISVTTGQTYAFFINNYSLAVNTGLNFSFTGSTFQISSGPQFSVSPDSICGSQGTITVANNTTGGAGFLWSFGDGATDTAINPGTHFYAQPGHYVISLTDTTNHGCAAVASKLVTVGPGSDTTFAMVQTCPGIPVTLNAPQLSGGNYLWSPGGASTQTIQVSPNVNSNYSVMCTSAINCSTIANFEVLATNNPTTSILGDSVICSGSMSTLSAVGGNTYEWGNNLGTNDSVVVSPATTTVYYVTTTFGANCSATASKTVVVDSVRPLRFTQSICQGLAYSFDNRVLTSAGTYIDTFTAITGCDSFVVLYLMVDSLPVPVVTRIGDTLQTQHFSSYIWQLNGVDITGADLQSFVITQAGHYSVAVIDSEGCGNTSAEVNIIDVGVAGVNSGNEVSLYPNPNAGNFTLKFTDDIEREVEIMDPMSRVVTLPVKVSRSKYFSTAELANGIYFIRISENGQTRSLKISVMR